jgi:hypothetical protein
MGKRYISPGLFAKQFLSDKNKPKNIWSDVYSDHSDPSKFKEWLKLIFNPERKFDVREGYGFSPMSAHNGILTYRFFKLFSDLGVGLYSDRVDVSGSSLKDLWEAHRIADYFIKMENLEDDLIEAMRLSGVSISEENKTQLLDSKNNKTNTSSRLNTNYYYDEESVELVLNRESLIIDLFEYQPPSGNWRGKP